MKGFPYGRTGQGFICLLPVSTASTLMKRNRKSVVMMISDKERQRSRFAGVGEAVDEYAYSIPRPYATLVP